MKLRQSFILGAAIAAGIFGLGAVGCGDDSAADTSSGSGGGATGSGGGSNNPAGGGGAPELTVPPTRPDGELPGNGDGAFLGISRLFLGESDRSGTPSTTAWESFGYDLDGKATVDSNGDGKFDGQDLTDHCTPVDGEVSSGNLEDGPGGLDNSFARNILPLLGGLLENPSSEATSAIEDGQFTIALRMDDLGADANYNPISTNLYAGIDRDADGNWQYVGALLEGDDIESPKIQFPNAYVKDNVWVSGEAQPITLSLSISGIDLELVIQNAIISVELDGARASGSNGVIAGVLDTEAFVAEIGKVASAIGGGDLCPGTPVFDGVVANIVNASDIMADGNNRGNVVCDGISIAIGFEMNEVTFGDIAPDPGPPEPGECE